MAENNETAKALETTSPELEAALKKIKELEKALETSNKLAKPINSLFDPSGENVKLIMDSKNPLSKEKTSHTKIMIVKDFEGRNVPLRIGSPVIVKKAYAEKLVSVHTFLVIDKVK